MTQQNDPKNREKREKTFDEHYRNLMASRSRLERLHIVTDLLEKKYDRYHETKEFIAFLSSVEQVFVHAEKETWSVERTQDELIKSEIYMLSQSSGVDEQVFLQIYEEFKSASHGVQRVQDVAQKMLEKYAQQDPHYKEYDDFILYVKDALLVFAQTLGGNKEFDEISEAKEQLIRLRMETIAADNRPPITVLQDIYEEFVAELNK